MPVVEVDADEWETLRQDATATQDGCLFVHVFTDSAWWHCGGPWLTSPHSLLSASLFSESSHSPLPPIPCQLEAQEDAPPLPPCPDAPHSLPLLRECTPREGM